MRYIATTSAAMRLLNGHYLSTVHQHGDISHLTLEAATPLESSPRDPLVKRQLDGLCSRARWWFNCRSKYLSSLDLVSWIPLEHSMDYSSSHRSWFARQCSQWSSISRVDRCHLEVNRRIELFPTGIFIKSEVALTDCLKEGRVQKLPCGSAFPVLMTNFKAFSRGWLNDHIKKLTLILSYFTTTSVLPSTFLRVYFHSLLIRR